MWKRALAALKSLWAATKEADKAISIGVAIFTASWGSIGVAVLGYLQQVPWMYVWSLAFLTGCAAYWLVRRGREIRAPATPAALEPKPRVDPSWRHLPVMTLEEVAAFRYGTEPHKIVAMNDRGYGLLQRLIDDSDRGELHVVDRSVQGRFRKVRLEHLVLWSETTGIDLGLD